MSGVVLVALTGCELLAGAPARVTLPPQAGAVLISPGIPVGRLNAMVLSRVSSQPGATVEVWHEWQRAPDMTAVSMGQAVAANLDADLRAFIPDLPPLEQDFAVCKNVTVNGQRQPVPTSATYPLLDLGDGTSMLRASGSLTGISIVPEVHTESTPALSTALLADGRRIASSFDISVSAANLAVGLVWNGTEFTTRLASVSMSCRATITEAPGVVARQCGEKLVRCAANTSVSVSGFTTDLPGASFIWASAQQPIQDTISLVLSRGVVLHFDNFFSGPMGFEGGGMTASLKMEGGSTVINGTSVCSPVPQGPPPPPPTRALLNAQARIGHGEDISQNGYVRKFELIPMMQSALVDGSGRSETLMPEQDVTYSDKGFSTFGREFEPLEKFRVNGAETRLRMRKHYPTGCWVKQTLFSDFMLREGIDVATRYGGHVIKEPSQELVKRSLTVLSIDKAPREDLAITLKQLDRDCGECEGWTLVRAVSLPPEFEKFPVEDPIGFPGGPMPWDVEIFIHDEPGRVLETYYPSLKCADASGKLDPDGMEAEKVSEVVHANPTVEMYGVKFDSRTVATSSYVDRVLHGQRWNFTYGARTETVVALTSACRFPNGKDETDYCWHGSLEAPELGEVRVVDAWSETVPARVPIRSATSVFGMSSYGSRTAAVQGHFDRSAVDVFTPVPMDYVRAGISSGGLDFRGTASLDWRHDSAFAEPNNFDHVTAFVRPLWLDRDTGAGGKWVEFFADWALDSVTFRRRPAQEYSYCTLTNDVGVGIRQLRFSGGGRTSAQPVDVWRLFNVAGQPHSSLPVRGANWAPTAPTAPALTAP